MKKFLKILLVFSMIFVSSISCVGCSNSSTAEQNIKYSLPDELSGTLKMFGNMKDIVFDIKLTKVGESIAMSMDSEQDSFIVTVSPKDIVIKRGNISVDVGSLENSPIKSIYALFMEFDAMKKIYTSDDKYTRVTASHKNTNYTLMFMDEKLSSVSTPEFELIILK